MQRLATTGRAIGIRWHCIGTEQDHHSGHMNSKSSSVSEVLTSLLKKTKIIFKENDGWIVLSEKPNP